MNKSFAFIIWNILLIITVVLIMHSCFQPDPVVITKTETKYNTIYRDANSMTPEEKQCYYTGIPTLDIAKGNGYEYVLSAGLCERKWQKVVKITPSARDSPNNLVTAGLIINNQGATGGQVQYYRLFGPVGIGGGGSIFNNSGFALNVGAVCMF